MLKKSSFFLNFSEYANKTYLRSRISFQKLFWIRKLKNIFFFFHFYIRNSVENNLFEWQVKSEKV